MDEIEELGLRIVDGDKFRKLEDFCKSLSPRKTRRTKKEIEQQRLREKYNSYTIQVKEMREKIEFLEGEIKKIERLLG